MISKKWLGHVADTAADVARCRLVGPAVSIAKRLARCAGCGAVVASAETVRGQGELAACWRFQEALQLEGGADVGAYALPPLAAAQYSKQQGAAPLPLPPQQDPPPSATRQHSE